ncbi:hypothetical protein K6119_04370 [Paracrocinitomix mangrovi]|uniref:hypothetical protein n=1 Tax=Paracrocinitomix mangrovi TaxID=2862509 RepID=UPI001C8D7D52|nr:hypothetical protein [Paracrocinitomix mangrovi]UKN02749.1 hypothetical protein K6119_04370 [Paracrocinitomix mangrovi]
MFTKTYILQFFLLAGLFIATTISFGQKQRTVSDTQYFLCEADSIYNRFIKDLKSKSVDTIFTLHYDFDNGRVENSAFFIIWRDRGKGFVRQFVGCDSIKSDTTYADTTSIVEDYFSMNVYNTKGIIETDIIQSHGMGYTVVVQIMDLQYSHNVRDWQRNNALNPSDQRIQWIDLFEKKIGNPCLVE